MSTSISLFLIVFLAGLTGCLQKPVTITVKPAISYETNRSFPDHRLEVGTFNAGTENARTWLPFISQYLQQQLNQKQTSQNLAGLPPISIGGKLSIYYGSFNYRNSTSQLKMDLEFQFIDPREKRILRSVQSTLFTRDETGIETQLQRAIDNMLESLFPSGMPIPVTLAKGFTRYDADGRKLASLGDYRRAATAFQMAIDARPDDHNALFNCGVMFEILNQPNLALDYYRRANQISPQAAYIDGIRRVQSIQ